MPNTLFSIDLTLKSNIDKGLGAIDRAEDRAINAGVNAYEKGENLANKANEKYGNFKKKLDEEVRTRLPHFSIILSSFKQLDFSI